jgi:hypothetical protein
VQKAGCSSLFDDLDAAPRSGASENRVAVPRQVTVLFLGHADRFKARTPMQISGRLAPVAKESLADRPGAADA